MYTETYRLVEIQPAGFFIILPLKLLSDIITFAMILCLSENKQLNLIEFNQRSQASDWLFSISVAQVSGEETNALALDATVSSQLLDSLINHQVAPGDIEIAQEDDGQSVIRMKSVTPRQPSHKGIISEMMGGVKEGHLYQQPKGKGFHIALVT